MFKTLLFFTIASVLVLTRGNSVQDEDEGDLDQIVGGFNAGPNDFPFTVLFKWSDNSNFCSGTLVTPIKVVTSALCAVRMINQINVPVPVRAVLRTLTPNPDPSAIWRNVIRIVIHPSYNPQTTMNDLAVVTLDSPVFNARTIPIGYQINLNGLEATAIGWGSNFQPGTTRILQWANIRVIPPLNCGNYFGNPQYTSGVATICLQSNNVASCTVDAGGPIITTERSTGRQFLIGVSSKSDCGIGRPIVAVRLQNYQGWLMSNI